MILIKTLSIINIIQILKNMNIFNSLNPTILGRWKLENNTRTFQKVDYANVDHCGSCKLHSISKK